jgi:hypothetical protein
MDSRSTLMAQIDLLMHELVDAGRAVQSQELDQYLRERVGGRFDVELSKRKARVEDLRNQVSSGQPLPSCWATFRQVEEDSRTLFDECLAFIQGALARAAGVDNGVCLLADHLLDDLSAWADVGWDRFTLLATGEFFKDTTEIIRVRFPDTSIWSLPIAAHEFGHFLGPELRENQDGQFIYPFQEMLKSADENRPPNWPLPHSQKWHHLHEHFADLFATVALGPAFACSFILLRLNPGNAYQEAPTSYAQRVHSILWVLDKMDQAAGGLTKPYRDVIDLIHRSWRQSLQATDQPESLQDVKVALLEARLDKLYALLLDNTPSKLAYQPQDWWRAVTLASQLQPDETWDAVQPEPDLTRRDVLNAAWLARVQQDEQVGYLLNEIGKRAVELYRCIEPRKGLAPAAPGP